MAWGGETVGVVINECVWSQGAVIYTARIEQRVDLSTTYENGIILAAPIAITLRNGISEAHNQIVHLILPFLSASF